MWWRRDKGEQKAMRRGRAEHSIQSVPTTMSALMLSKSESSEDRERESTSKKDIGWWIPCLKLFIL